MPRRLPALVLAVFALAACGTPGLSPTSLDLAVRLRGKTVVQPYYPPPRLASPTPSGGPFGWSASGAPAQAEAALARVALPDPAQQIGERLGFPLLKRHRVSFLQSRRDAGGDTPAELLATYPEADFIFDLRSLSWQLQHYTADWDRYRVAYRVRLRLIERSGARVVAHHDCSTVADDDANPPNYAQLLANDAQRLKALFARAGTACASEFAQVLQL